MDSPIKAKKDTFLAMLKSMLARMSLLNHNLQEKSNCG